MLIGITGIPGCGKGEVVKVLERVGFKHITFSSVVRDEAKKRGLEETRANLQEIGNSMRKEHGPGALGKMLLKKIKAQGGGDWIVDGIRNPAEIDEIRKEKDVYVIGLEADWDLVIERLIKRAREGDPVEPDELMRRIEREWGVGEKPDGFNIEKCIEKSDVVINNDGTLKQLDTKVTKYYKSLKRSL
jgi:dephospho-CoA kinase